MSEKAGSNEKLECTARNDSGVIIEEYYVPDCMVGLIIGRRGDQIVRLQAESGCEIQLATESRGLPDRLCTLSGTRDSIRKCKSMIDKIIHKASSFHPPNPNQNNNAGKKTHLVELMIPGKKVGLLIGRGGGRIKTLQRQNGVKMMLIQENPEVTEHEKLLQITGDPEKVEHVKQLVIDFLHPMSAPVTACNDRTSAEIIVPMQAVGLVIGKSGDTIKKIQGDSGATIKLVPSSDNSHGDKICHISGNIDQVESASDFIHDLVQNSMTDYNNNQDVPHNKTTRRRKGRGGSVGPRLHRDSNSDYVVGNNIMLQEKIYLSSEKFYSLVSNTGEKLQNIVTQSAVTIQEVGHNSPNTVELKVSGGYEQIQLAKKLINDDTNQIVGEPVPQNQLEPYVQHFEHPFASSDWGNMYLQYDPQQYLSGASDSDCSLDVNCATTSQIDSSISWYEYYSSYHTVCEGMQKIELDPAENANGASELTSVSDPANWMMTPIPTAMTAVTPFPSYGTAVATAPYISMYAHATGQFPYQTFPAYPGYCYPT